MSRIETKQRIPHMLMDTDFYEKPENIEAIDKFGDIAPSCIQRICFKLMNEQGARMKKSQVLAMWRATTNMQEVWAEMVEYYIGCGWLIEEGDYLSSNRTRQERERVEQKRSILSANAKQKLSKSSSKEEQKESKSSDTDTDTESNKKNSELRFAQKVAYKGFDVLTVPTALATPDLTDAVTRWAMKLHSQGRELDQMTLDAQMLNLGLDKVRILKAINYSCSLTKCLNLLEPPDRSVYVKPLQTTAPPKKATQPWNDPNFKPADPNSEESLKAKKAIEELLK